MSTFKIFIPFILLFSFFTSVNGQSSISEKDYSNYIQSLIGGQLEYSVPGGRVDLVTNEYAFEIEKAYNWKESIGQALWYALNTNKKPGIILILEESSDYKYSIQLHTALEYAELQEKVQVYIFPNDFQELIEKQKK